MELLKEAFEAHKKEDWRGEYKILKEVFRYKNLRKRIFEELTDESNGNPIPAKFNKHTIFALIDYQLNNDIDYISEIRSEAKKINENWEESLTDTIQDMADDISKTVIKAVGDGDVYVLIDCEVLSVKPSDGELRGDHLCGNYFVDSKIKANILGFDFEGDFNFEMSKWGGGSIQDVVFCGKEFLDVMDDIEAKYIYDDIVWEIAHTIADMAGKSKLLQDLNDKQLELDEEHEKNYGKCPYCGDEMDWEPDLSNAEFSRGGTLISDFDDHLENGYFVCNKEECAERSYYER